MLNKPQFFVVLDKIMGRRRHPRNGKVARLPEPTRNLINQMLDDGLPYRAILETLQRPGASPLPYTISEMNLSNWKNGGYQDWLSRGQQSRQTQPNRT